MPGQVDGRAPADALALQGPPGERQGDGGLDRVGRDPVPQPADVAHEHRPAAARVDGGRAGPRPWGRGRHREETARRATPPAVRSSGLRPGLAEEQVEQRLGGGRAPVTRLGPRMLAAAASMALGALPASRAASAAASMASRCRSTWAAMVTLASGLSLGPLRSRRTVRHRSIPTARGRPPASRCRGDWRPASPGPSRWHRGILHPLADEDGTDLAPGPADLAIVGGGASTTGRSSSAGRTRP